MPSPEIFFKLMYGIYTSNAGIYLPVGVEVPDIAISTVGLGFDFRAGQIEDCRQRLATAATFLCCPGAKSWRCHSSHTLA